MATYTKTKSRSAPVDPDHEAFQPFLFDTTPCPECGGQFVERRRKKKSPTTCRWYTLYDIFCMTCNKTRRKIYGEVERERKKNQAKK